MNIVYTILGGSYTDGFSYQENLMAKYHKMAGNDVTVITSSLVRDDSGNVVEYQGETESVDINGVKVIRLPFSRPKKISGFLRKYEGFKGALEKSKPDLLFIHGCQSCEMKVIADYLKSHPEVWVLADNHADYQNSARNFLSKNILHGLLWKHCAKTIEPYTEKFYGVLPARVDFLKKAYGSPAGTCEIRVLGVDDDEAQKALAPGVRKNRREEYGVSDDDFVIVTGGKIDSNKPQVISLMKAVNSLAGGKIKLIVFGSVTDELKRSFEKNLGDSVKYIGWRRSEDIYTDFAAADLVAFPGLHSVLWEQAVGMGKPCAFKRIKGFEHVDLGGNCVFFENDSEQEYIRVIKYAQENIGTLKNEAEKKGMKTFSYKEIAKRAIAR